MIKENEIISLDIHERLENAKR